jgi:hypothetical protein
VPQVVECLPSKGEVLSSKPSTDKKKMIFIYNLKLKMLKPEWFSAYSV